VRRPDGCPDRTVVNPFGGTPEGGTANEPPPERGGTDGFESPRSQRKLAACATSYCQASVANPPAAAKWSNAMGSPRISIPNSAGSIKAGSLPIASLIDRRA
jgi:hypothetical protein